MKMQKNYVMIVFLLVFSISFVFAAIPSYQDKYVNDFAGVFSSLQVGELKGLLSSVDADTTAELTVVTASDCASYGDPSQYATQILNSWKVGKADKNNGLVALYCSVEKKFWISVGYGLEGILPDSKIGRMLDESYVPLRDSGNTTEGIISFMKSVSGVIEQNKDEVLSGQAGGSSGSSSIPSWVFIFVFWIIFTIISKILQKKYNKKGVRMPWFVPIFLPSGNGGGFGGGGLGGGGFGGGGGGGGGAGR